MISAYEMELYATMLGMSNTSVSEKAPQPEDAIAAETELYAMMIGISNMKLAKKDPQPGDIIAAVAATLQITETELKGKSQKRDITEARFITMMLLNEYCDLKAAMLGQLFNRDRTTAMLALRVARDLQDDKRFYAKTVAVQNQLMEVLA